MGPSFLDEPKLSGSRDGEAALQSWRKYMLSRVSLGLAGIFLLGSLLVLFRSESVSKNMALLILLPAAVASFMVYWAQAWSLAVRAGALFFVTLVVFGIVLFRVGVQTPSPFVIAATASVLGVLLVGRHAGLIALSIYLLVATLAAVAVGAKFVELSPLAPPDSLNAWVSIVVVFALCSGVSVWCVGYLMERLQVSLEQREGLIRQLRVETSARVAQLERRNQLEEQLRQAQKMDALGTLAGGIAHDFNNRLLVIVSGARAAREANTEELQEILDEIEEAGQRGASLTQQLLTFGRQRVSQKELVDLNDAVRDSLQMIRRLIPEDMSLEFLPSADVASVELSRVDLEQVLINLCVNARDAMPEGGTISVKTEFRAEGEEEAQAVLSVRDGGQGMNEELKGRVFEPFFTTKAPGEGTGLGLAIVHSIMQSHSGSVELESSPGLGTVVRLCFPHVVRRSMSFSRIPVLENKAGCETILVVDDDGPVRHAMSRILRMAGYEVLTAEDGARGFEIYQARIGEIALVLTDAVMPQMGGQEMCKKILQLDPTQPCLICSGYDRGTLEEAFFEPKSRAFMSKPFDNEVLVKMVKRLVASRSRP